MNDSVTSKTKLENFDDLFVGSPADIEKNMASLLPEAKNKADKSIYVQILSQIAVAQAMQQKIEKAHDTLKKAENYLSKDDFTAKIRIHLSRGRILHQDHKFSLAISSFEKAYELALQNKLDYYAIDAAHVAAMVVEKVEQKISWNLTALKLALKTKNKKAQMWLGTLYNNLGQNYLEAKNYKEAHPLLVKALEFRKKEGLPVMIRGAKWAVAKSAWRLGEDIDNSLQILLELKKEYDQMLASDTLDIPKELLPVARGPIYEELTEIYLEKAKHFSTLAYQDLSKDPWFIKLAPKRLERLKNLKDID